MKEIVPRVYQLSGPWGVGVWGANVFLLIDDTLTLVDTGFKGRATQILKEVGRLGYSPSDITNIIITHHHADHVGSLAALKKATQARIMAHPADVPYINGQLPQPGPAGLRWLGKTLAPLYRLWTTTPTEVDIQVNEGDELPIIGGINVFHTPGHTLGSISLLLQKERLLIAGDVLAHRFGLRLPSKAFTIDIAQEVRSIERLASLDFDIMCFGHGSPLLHETHATVNNFAAVLERKYQKTH